jgi:hypothetical protein
MTEDLADLDLTVAAGVQFTDDVEAADDDVRS